MSTKKTKSPNKEKNWKELTASELTHITGGTTEKIVLATEKVERAK